MRRRDLLCSGCGCGLLTLVPDSATGGVTDTPRFVRPDLASDEGGLWALMDREEERLRRSRFLLADDALQRYVSDIACRLAGDHCPDMRVYLVRTPYFNASMAPNGMMQVWSGLLLRAANEAQLAAVLAHEVGHYLKRHSLERLRDARAKAGFAQFLGLALGAAGAGSIGQVAQLGVLASVYAFSRDHEREADAIGLEMMHRAGYDASEAAKVWAQLIEENAGEDGGGTLLFATHPSADERRDTLRAAATTLAGDRTPGETHAERYRAHIAPLRLQMLQDELRRRVPDSSLRLFDRLMTHHGRDGQLLYARAEALRTRARDDDLDQALAALGEADSQPDQPVEAFRLRGQILRSRNDSDGARHAFRNYLELRPDAPDAQMIRSYIETPTP